jgi:hypothetical protein
MAVVHGTLMAAGVSDPLPRNLAGHVYLLAARVSAQALRRQAMVDRILVHRSVATGEVTFGRSDIDLVLVLRPDPDLRRHGAEMWALCRNVHRLRLINPALGHVEAYDAGGWADWHHIDTYRGSEESRGARTLVGAAYPAAATPVRPEHAIRRFVLMPLHHLTAALIRRDHRTLRKIALDMWNAYAVATGLVSMPFLCRAASAAHYRRSDEFAELGEPGETPSRLMDFMWALSARLHGRVLGHLAGFTRRQTVRLPVPPYGGARTFILPVPGDGQPVEAVPNTTILSAEALHLFVHFVNPFVWHALPADLVASGFRQPALAAYVAAGRYQFSQQVLRYPGLMSDASDLARAWSAFLQAVLPDLEGGRCPSSRSLQTTWSGRAPAAREYYLTYFPALCRSHEEITGRLRQIDQSPCPA